MSTLSDHELCPPLLELPANRTRRNYRGGLLLDQLRGQSPAQDNNQPEDWIASTVEARNPGLDPVPHEGLATVRIQDQTFLLRDLFKRYGEHYLGPAHVRSLGPQLGFLMKLLDASMRLHVQAHPTAAWAQQHLNSRWGKLETYLIVGVRPGHDGHIRLGFQHPPTPQEWRRIVFEQDIAAMDACFEPVPVQVGEVWLVPGGLPHAIGAGLLVVEVMEPTDWVVRCEFERLGIVVPPAARFMGRDPELAMQIFDYQRWSVPEAQQRWRITPQVLHEDAGHREELLIGPAQTGCFENRRWVFETSATLQRPSVVEIGLVLEGQGTIEAGGRHLSVSRGSTFLLAAAAKQVKFHAHARPLTVMTCRPGSLA